MLYQLSHVRVHQNCSLSARLRKLRRRHVSMPADRPLAAGELARLAGVSAATASFHLAKLLEGGMITVVRQGRHRYYRLGLIEEKPGRTDRGDTPALRFEITGPSAAGT